MRAHRPPPPVSLSRRIVRLLLTRTFPRRSEQRRKFPMARIGMMDFALAFSFFDPVFLTISSSVWSRAMSPRLRPENNPDRHSRNTARIAISQIGINALESVIDSSLPLPW